MKVSWFIALILIGIIFSGCDATTPAAQNSGVAPTLDPRFNRTSSANVSDANSAEQPTIASAFRSDAATPIVRDPAAITPQVFTGPTSTPRNPVIEKIIFDDTLDPSWTLDNSVNTKVDPKSAARVKSGKLALAVTPTADYGMLYFTVRIDAKESYLRANVWGASVWINGGDNTVGPEDLAITLMGSNAVKYWVANDRSVTVDQKNFFSETRLYFLGITRVVPANTWVEVPVQLDQLVYDPDYKYVTGIYLKNDPAFKKTYYVDHVALLMLK